MFASLFFDCLHLDCLQLDCLQARRNGSAVLVMNQRFESESCSAHRTICCDVVGSCRTWPRLAPVARTIRAGGRPTSTCRVAERSMDWPTSNCSATHKGILVTIDSQGGAWIAAQQLSPYSGSSGGREPGSGSAQLPRGRPAEQTPGGPSNYHPLTARAPVLRATLRPE